MTDLIVLLIVGVILAFAIGYIVKAKKNGAKCIGCPSGSCCCTGKDEEPTGCNCCCQAETDN